MILSRYCYRPITVLLPSCYRFWLALLIVHHRDTTVPHRLSSFFTTPSRLKTLIFSRVQGARKPLSGHNSLCPPIQIGKFYTIFLELKSLLVKHTRMFIADSERAWKVGLTFWADQTSFKSFWKWPIFLRTKIPLYWPKYGLNNAAIYLSFSLFYVLKQTSFPFHFKIHQVF